MVTSSFQNQTEAYSNDPLRLVSQLQAFVDESQTLKNRLTYLQVPTNQLSFSLT